MSDKSDLEKRQEEGSKVKREQSKKEGRLNAEENNPCLTEYRLSLQCMKDNNYEENTCINFFDNYRTCKKFWLWVERDRRRKGIRPNVPPLAERAKVKEELQAEFLKTIR